MPVLQQAAQVFQFAAQVVAGLRDVADRQPQRGQFTGQVFGVGLGLLGSSAILVDRDAVSVLLAVLGQQDQRRRVGGLGGKRQVEQDEWVGVPAQG